MVSTTSDVVFEDSSTNLLSNAKWHPASIIAAPCKQDIESLKKQQRINTLSLRKTFGTVIRSKVLKRTPSTSITLKFTLNRL